MMFRRVMILGGWIAVVGCDAPGIDGRDRPAELDDEAGLVINEVLADEPGRDPAGEFIEIVNGGEDAADLSGFTLSDGVLVRHVFADGTTLAPGAALVVVGGAAGLPPEVAAIPASTGSLGLSNKGDLVRLTGPDGDDRNVFLFGDSLTEDAISINRNPEVSGQAPLILHSELSDLMSSPGTRSDGSPFDGEPPPPPPGSRIRIAAANLTSGNDQSYDLGHGTRILKALVPDVTLIQELNFGENSDGEIRAFIDDAFGPEFQYARQGGMKIPSGVVSRFPIVASGVWNDPAIADRDFVWARIDLPGERDLWAVSVHLSGQSSGERSQGVSALLDRIDESVPDDDFLVIGGDFNTQSRTEQCIDMIEDVVVTSGPYPADQGGDTDTNEPRSRPYDWVLVDPDLHSLAVPVVIADRQFANGLVFDSRRYQPLSEVPPVEHGDSGSFQMQHMAVVRDFDLGK